MERIGESERLTPPLDLRQALLQKQKGDASDRSGHWNRKEHRKSLRCGTVVTKEIRETGKET